MLSLWEGKDRLFVGAATLAHLSISALGAATLAARDAANTDAIEVALFLLTGAVTAMLLLRASHSAERPVGRRLGEAREQLYARPQDRSGSAYGLAAFTASGIRLDARPGDGAGIERSAAQAFSGLMSHVSHELRTPLNAIIGFADLMQRELLGPLGSPRYQEYVRHIRESGLAVLRAAEDTMAFTTVLADRGRGCSQTVDLRAVLEQACRDAIPRARSRRIELIQGAASVTLVRAEPRGLQQALSHLVSAGVLRASAARPMSVSLHVAGRCARLSIAYSEEACVGGEDGRAQLSLAIAKALLEVQGITLAERRGSGKLRRLTVAIPLAVVAFDNRSAAPSALLGAF
jgi:signal transduction histidine kinase